MEPARKFSPPAQVLATQYRSYDSNLERRMSFAFLRLQSAPDYPPRLSPKAGPQRQECRPFAQTRGTQTGRPEPGGILQITALMLPVLLLATVSLAGQLPAGRHTGKTLGGASLLIDSAPPGKDQGENQPTPQPENVPAESSPGDAAQDLSPGGAAQNLGDNPPDESPTAGRNEVPPSWNKPAGSEPEPSTESSGNSGESGKTSDDGKNSEENVAPAMTPEGSEAGKATGSAASASVSPGLSESKAPNSPPPSGNPSATAGTQSSGPTTSPADATGPYLLRYRFQPGETVRWEVLQQARVKTTVGGTTQTAESVTRSVKLWRIVETKPDGSVTFEHLVESVEMWQKLTGRDEVRFNSQSGEDPPRGFEAIAQSLNVPLATVTMDARGQILKRQRHPVKTPVDTEPLMTILLPEEPVEAGASWSFPYEIELPLENGTVKVIKAAEIYKLREVKSGVAIIEVSTKVLTPINDPRLEAKLVQREREGIVRFDIAAGRLLEQQLDLDRRVVGFSGPASTLQYASRITEVLLPPQQGVARSPGSGSATK